MMQSRKFREWLADSVPTNRGTGSNSDLRDSGETAISPLSPVSTQPSSPSNRTGQVPREVP